mmetsp:Transcript_17476/g.57235  ORF Transcript_17476/g.57235 Transcript_17476/m.57235 type:complete len:266 (+) Transcript_17476:427-1224(+)
MRVLYWSTVEEQLAARRLAVGLSRRRHAPKRSLELRAGDAPRGVQQHAERVAVRLRAALACHVLGQQVELLRADAAGVAPDRRATAASHGDERDQPLRQEEAARERADRRARRPPPQVQLAVRPAHARGQRDVGGRHPRREADAVWRHQRHLRPPDDGQRHVGRRDALKGGAEERPCARERPRAARAAHPSCRRRQQPLEERQVRPVYEPGVGPEGERRDVLVEQRERGPERRHAEREQGGRAERRPRCGTPLVRGGEAVAEPED